MKPVMQGAVVGGLLSILCGAAFGADVQLGYGVGCVLVAIVALVSCLGWGA